jgi:mercuric ion transport protein
MKHRMVLGVLPAIVLSAIPAVACPACVPTLVSLLSAIGLTFLTNRAYLLWVNLVALVLALAMLLVKRHTKGYSPILLGTAGAVTIMLGKFVFVGNMLTWSGWAVLVFASALSTFGRRGATMCDACGINTSVIGEENQHGKEKG